MKVPIRFFLDLPGVYIENDSVNDPVLVIGGMLGRALEHLFAIESDEDMVGIEEIERLIRLVFREAIHARKLTVADRGEIDMRRRSRFGAGDCVLRNQNAGQK